MKKPEVRFRIARPGEEDAEGATLNLWRGHVIAQVYGRWYYLDTHAPVDEEADRACGHCGLANTPEGYDGCIGHIPGALNACCGHGTVGDAYVQFADGLIAGQEALELQAKAKK